LFAIAQPGTFVRAYGIITGSNSLSSLSLKGVIVMHHPAQLFTDRIGCSFRHLQMGAGGFAAII